MTPLNQALLQWTGSFALIFVRIMAIFTVSPIFGRRNLASFAKIGLSILITYIILPLVNVTFIAASANLFSYSLLVIKEVFLGLIIGYVTTVIFTAPLLAGQIIDMQIGFGMVQIFDPGAGSQVAITGNLLNIIMLLAFFFFNGPLILIQILVDSFTNIPVGTLIYNADVAWRMLECFSQMLVLSIKIAMPVIGIMAIAEVCLGIIVRSVPQMNVFVVGIPLKIFLGVIALFLITPIYMYFLNGVFNDMFHFIEATFDMLAG